MTKPSSFFLDYRSKWRDGAPLEPRRRQGKTKEIQVIADNLTGKPTILIGDSITKNMEGFAPSYPRYFPASTVLNAGIAGDTVEAILYRVEIMNIPSSVSHISLLCGTNNLSSHSPATISSTITEILFLLRQKCPTTYIHLFPILPRFDQLHEHVTATNSLIYFQVQELFPEFVLFHELPSSLYNQNLYRGDKLHLTTKGNDILVRWFHHCITTSNPTNPEPNTPPFPHCKMFPLLLSLQIPDTDWPPLPAPKQPSKPTIPSPYRYSKRSPTPLHVPLPLPLPSPS